ncbi:hypothetical protein NDU88_001495 [Pleurodeles waltl]|uniref:Uncharacterized protein n=1 Tax=Pleurodeles waltl TaxID=8319 RepID=A0AAV7THX5_PLEWA|nr:hypothetical protein NDU88_001495 [Pleurodeles waltl]
MYPSAPNQGEGSGSPELRAVPYRGAVAAGCHRGELGVYGTDLDRGWLIPSSWGAPHLGTNSEAAVGHVAVLGEVREVI